MTRLTKDIKETICKNAIESSPLTKKLIETRGKLGQLAIDIYNDATNGFNIPVKIQEIYELINALPLRRGYNNFYERKSISCNLGGMRCELFYPNDSVERYLVKDEVIYKADHKYTKTFLKLDSLLSDLLKQKKELEAEIMAVLNSCTTLNKLKTIWKESSDFLDGIIGKEESNLPAVIVDDLNKKLGIKKD